MGSLITYSGIATKVKDVYKRQGVGGIEGSSVL